MLKSSFQPVIRLLLPIMDMTILSGTLFASMWLRVGYPAENWPSFWSALPWSLIFGYLVYYAFGLYVVNLRSPSAVVRQIILSNLVLTAGLGVLAFWLRAFAIPRSVIIMAFLMNGMLSCSWRLAWVTVNRWLSGQRQVLVVGTELDCAAMVAKLRAVPQGWFHVVGVLQPDELLSTSVANLSDKIDTLILGSSTSPEERRAILAVAQQANLAIYVIPDLYDIIALDYESDQIDDIPVFRFRPLGLQSGARLAKRVLDLSIAMPLSIIVAPVVLVMAALIKLTSAGSAFYSQTRVGEHHTIFTIWKLRTMVTDAERHGAQMALRDDPRVTPLGRFLRATRLDELPQLWNVLIGDMSLVGPRPERPEFVEQFAAQTPEYHLRHLVKPGITGLAQVLANYSTSFADKLRYDLYYIRHQGVWMDLKIILLTVRAVLRSESAQGTERKVSVRVSPWQGI